MAHWSGGARLLPDGTAGVTDPLARPPEGQVVEIRAQGEDFRLVLKPARTWAELASRLEAVLRLALGEPVSPARR